MKSISLLSGYIFLILATLTGDRDPVAEESNDGNG